LPAVGRRFKTSVDHSYEIVGIVEDGKYDSLTETPKAAMFFPLAQNPDTDTTVVVRSDLPPAQITPALSETLHRIDPDLPFVIHSWTEALAFVLFPAQAAAVSLGCMGLLAALLAVTGVFGVAAYTISKRRRELGIRIALGARSLQVLQTALGRPLTLLTVGSAGGFLAGLLASRLLEQIVYQATPRDALVWLGMVLIMLLLGASATWIPARRALRTNPALLLKEDL
jgi:ABC-type antimicrobial peptide transport system permease subunit